jgi:3-oxoacyl-[acyl-carrier protein] reductase
MTSGARTTHIAFVTGAAQGLGAAIARALHRAGHAVAIADANYPKAEALAADMARFGPAPICAVNVDIRSKESIVLAAREVTEKLGEIDILVNNAGLTRAKEFFDISEEDWNEVLEVNLRGMFFSCQVIAPSMISKRWGRIINLASVAGQRGGPQVQGLHYASSKAGIIGLTRYLAYELGQYGVTVNSIAPGPIVTEQTKLAPPEKLERVAKDLPVKRLGEAEDVGALAAFLCSPHGGFMTGSTLDINGGLLMR